MYNQLLYYTSLTIVLNSNEKIILEKYNQQNSKFANYHLDRTIVSNAASFITS